MILDIHPRAIDEIVEAYEFYHEREPEVAERFLEAVDAVVQRILYMPNSGLNYDYGTRRVLLKKYPYQLIFRQHQDTLRILAVAHQTREPGYWADRE